MARLIKLFLFSLLIVSASGQVVSARQVAAWRKQMRQALFIPDQLPAPAVRATTSFVVSPGVTAERISYVTEFGLHVPAVLYRPTVLPRGKLPAMLLVDGHGGDKASWYTYYTGVLYAQAGAVVLTYDAIGTGEASDEHKQADNEHDLLIDDPPTMPARMGGRMIADILQGVSVLTARSEVDPGRIAVLGFSMGSFHVALAGALDPRIHALLLTGGGDLDGPGGYWESSHAVMCQAGPYKALRFLGDVPAVLYTMNARRGDTFILNGTADTVVDIPNHGPGFFAGLRGRVVALNGGERGVFTTYFDPGASHRPNWMTRVAATWLEQELHLPGWTPTGMATLRVQTMRAWAGQTAYELSKSAAREDRDAGLEMIAADVPRLTQDQLDVLPRAAWDAQKKEYVYSTWVERALAEARRVAGTR